MISFDNTARARHIQRTKLFAPTSRSPPAAGALRASARPCSGAADQRWSLRPSSPGHVNVVACHSGTCLAVPGGSTTAEAPFGPAGAIGVHDGHDGAVEVGDPGAIRGPHRVGVRLGVAGDVGRDTGAEEVDGEAAPRAARRPSPLGPEGLNWGFTVTS
ncbi:RICIN domain-containing protein [Kitasatospora sp. NPDC093102]|uniref:RICIN domain-containing protein n=1 Tax=Kitasatospora sp. NPDC093102 TaxID=3155069 RepID=UPI00343BA686